MKGAMLAMTLLATPAFAQITALPEAVQARIREIGPTMGLSGVNGTGEALAPVMPENPPPSLRDVAYGSDPRHRLDVWSPGAGSRPVLVFVHGGGFTGGNKSREGAFYYDNIAAWAARQGMVGVNITYRLAPAHRYPSAVEDIAAALAWIRAHIAAQGGDPARIVLMGQSAGAAHVADYLAHHAAGPGVAAAVLVSGVYHLEPRRMGPPEHAYYPNDAVHSELPGLSRLRIPLLAAIAAHEPQSFRDQGMMLNGALCTHACPAFLDLAGHNHFSTVFDIGSADTELSNAILALANRTTP